MAYVPHFQQCRAASSANLDSSEHVPNNDESIFQVCFRFLVVDHTFCHNTLLFLPGIPTAIRCRGCWQLPPPAAPCGRNCRNTTHRLRAIPPGEERRTHVNLLKHRHVLLRIPIDKKCTLISSKTHIRLVQTYSRPRPILYRIVAAGLESCLPHTEISSNQKLHRPRVSLTLIGIEQLRAFG